MCPGHFPQQKRTHTTPILRNACLSLQSVYGCSKRNCNSHWKLGDAPAGYLCTNIGIRALFHVVKDIADHIRQKDSSDLYLLDADETFAEIKPYIKALVDYFKNATAQEIQSFRRVGSSLKAVRDQAYGMDAQIQKTFPNFKPAGLQEYLDSRDVAGTEIAAAKVLKIQKKLFDHVVGTLKNNYGTQDKAWWVKGIPADIRIECSKLWEAKDRQGDEENELYLINYISISMANWELFKNSVSLGTKNLDDKKKATNWIKDLNEIRNKVAHPERGVLTTKEVEFVNEVFERVETYLSGTGAQDKAVA